MELKKFFFNKFVLLGLLIVLAGIGFLVWKSLSGPSPEARYKTQEVTTGDITQTVSANGTLNPVVLVNVGTQVSGTVRKIYADFNDKVKQGQVLMELDPSLFQAQVAQSEANVSNAQASVDLAEANEARMQELYKKEYVTKQELDTAIQTLKSSRAQLALAKAQLQKDRINLNYSVIRSPVSGVVVSREVDVGQTVAASFQTPTLFKIAQDLSKMQIDSSFAEADIGNIKVGQPVRFSVDAFPDKTFKGIVRQVRLNPTTLQNVVTYNVVVAVDNPEKILLPGMTAYVNIVVAEKKNVLSVPNAALRFKPSEGIGSSPSRSRQNRSEKGTGPSGTVYLLESGKLKPVSVTTGITDNRFTEVLGGELKAGDKVVTETVQTNGNGRQPGSFRFRMF